MTKNHAQVVTIPLIAENVINATPLDKNWNFARHAEDVVIALPSTMDNYIVRLGKQTRKHLLYYVRRLEREWSLSLDYVSVTNQDIQANDFQCLVDLNRMRMISKGSRSGWTAAMVADRWHLACSTGLLTGIYHDGQLAAGTVCYLHRGEAFLVLIAHNPCYDDLNLGSIALYKTIDTLITRGCTMLHLLWGRGFYKRQFGGEEKPLFEGTLIRRRYQRYLWHCFRAAHVSSQKTKSVLKPLARKMHLAFR